MNALEIILAIVIVLAAAVQILILVLLYRLVSRLLVRTDKLLDTIEPEIRDAATSVRTVRTVTEISAREVSELIAGVRTTADELSSFVRTESRRISGLIDRTVEVAERQLEEGDRALDVARARMSDIGYRFDRAVLEPARIMLALGVGIRKGLETIVARDRDGTKKEPRSDTDGRLS